MPDYSITTIAETFCRSLNSNGDVMCFVCERVLPFQFLTLAHIIAKANGGEDLFIAECIPCNNRQQKRNAKDFFTTEVYADLLRRLAMPLDAIEVFAMSIELAHQEANYIQSITRADIRINTQFKRAPKKLTKHFAAYNITF